MRKDKNISPATYLVPPEKQLSGNGGYMLKIGQKKRLWDFQTSFKNLLSPKEYLIALYTAEAALRIWAAADNFGAEEHISEQPRQK